MEAYPNLTPISRGKSKATVESFATIEDMSLYGRVGI